MGSPGKRKQHKSLMFSLSYSETKITSSLLSLLPSANMFDLLTHDKEVVRCEPLKHKEISDCVVLHKKTTWMTEIFYYSNSAIVCVFVCVCIHTFLPCLCPHLKQRACNVSVFVLQQPAGISTIFSKETQCGHTFDEWPRPYLHVKPRCVPVFD